MGDLWNELADCPFIKFGLGVTVNLGGMGWDVRVRFKRKGTYDYIWLIHVDKGQKHI